MSININTKTSQSIDVIKGSLILLVVFGHLLGASIENAHIKYLYNFIYTFHMPAFIFFSGFLSKNEATIQPEKIIKNIIIPFIIFDFLYETLNYATTGSLSGYIKIGAPYWIMWYLLSLCFWRLLSPFFLKLKYPLTISIIISIAFQFVDFSSQTLSLLRTFSFLPFYVMGCLAYKLSLFDKKIPSSYVIAFGLTSVSTLAFISINVPTIFLYGTLPYYAFNMSLQSFMFYKLIGFIAVPALLLSILNLTLSNKILSAFGKNSFPVYALHGLFILYISTYLSEHTSGKTTVLLAFLVSFITCYVFSRVIISNAIRQITDWVYHRLVK